MLIATLIYLKQWLERLSRTESNQASTQIQAIERYLARADQLEVNVWLQSPAVRTFVWDYTRDLPFLKKFGCKGNIVLWNQKKTVFRSPGQIVRWPVEGSDKQRIGFCYPAFDRHPNVSVQDRIDTTGRTFFDGRRDNGAWIATDPIPVPNSTMRLFIVADASPEGEVWVKESVGGKYGVLDPAGFAKVAVTGLAPQIKDRITRGLDISGGQIVLLVPHGSAAGSGVAVAVAKELRHLGTPLPVLSFSGNVGVDAAGNVVTDSVMTKTF